MNLLVKWQSKLYFAQIISLICNDIKKRRRLFNEIYAEGLKISLKHFSILLRHRESVFVLSLC